MSKVIWVSSTAANGGTGTEANPYQTIKQAIAVAEPGTTIKVMPGTYVENVSFKASGTADAPITLVSAGGPGAAVIKPASSSYDTVAVGGYDHIVIDGFTIHAPNSAMNGIAVYARQSSGFDPATYITIQNNMIVGSAGDGIKGSKAEYLTIQNNTITGLTADESGIDFVGVNHAVIRDNTVSDINDIGIMVKGGSTDVVVEGNLIEKTGSSGIEIGGYTELAYYWPGFLEKNAYEVKGVVVADNEIRDTGGTGLRLIGAQQVDVVGNEIHDAGNYIVSIDDSSMYHSVWKGGDISFEDNSFESSGWLKNRSAGSEISQADNFTDGRDLGAGPDGPEQTPAPTTPYEPPTTPPDPGPVAFDGIVWTGTSGGDSFAGTKLADHLLGQAGDDKLDGGGGDDTVEGGVGKDQLEGGNGDDTILGGADNDKLKGDNGDDTLQGGAGNDEVKGNDGNDILWGGPGADRLKGGDGSDTFVFRELDGQVDRIEDFTPGTDHIAIDIEGVDGFSDLTFRNDDGSTVISVQHSGGTIDIASVDDVTPSLFAIDSFHFI